MNSLKHFELGAPFPDSPHAVASSLPTMVDVCGYEEQDPRVMAALNSGYPRFVVHRFIKELLDYYLEVEGLEERFGVLVPSRRSAQDLVDCLDGGVVTTEVEEGLFLIHCDAANESVCLSLRRHLQHKGYGLSSRQAEDLLIGLGRLSSAFTEETFAGNALGSVEIAVASECDCRQADVLICSSGMSAFYAAFRAVQEFQKDKGRRKWLQLGWLYLDSGCILKEFLSEDESLGYCYDVLDTESIIKEIRAAGDDLAAVVVECPTNPLAQVCDLERIAAAVRECGGVMIVDPTIASIYNAKVLPCADILVTSLTKYAASAGDVMAGVLVVNSDSPFYGDLVLRASRFHAPLYGRDLGRLAHEMKTAGSVVARMNANAVQLAVFFEKHPAVEKVWSASSREPLLPNGGGIVTIELRGSLELFYDTIAVMKGPSFGTRFTLLSPFMYLAHYDLVTSEKGRRFLSEAGLNPELIRIAVGEEPIEELECVFAQALDATL